MGSVSEKKLEIGRRFKLVFGYVLNNLVERSDSGAASDHVEVMIMFFPGFFAKIK